MAAQGDIIEKAVAGALEQIQKNAPAEYAKLTADPGKKDKLVQAARATATETVQLAKEFASQPQDIEKRLSKHLPADRIRLLRGGLSIPTFRMQITKKADGKHWLDLTREGKEFAPARALASTADIDWGNVQQLASILVEGILLVMSAVGISVSPGGQAIEHAVDEAAQAIRTSSKLQRALDKFIAAWNAAGGNAYQKAKALFFLIKDSYGAGILWTIIKSLCSNMAWYDWLETAAKVTAMIIAALATDGAALIAEIALIVLSAVDFARKIANIVQLAEIKKTL